MFRKHPPAGSQPVCLLALQRVAAYIQGSTADLISTSSGRCRVSPNQTFDKALSALLLRKRLKLTYVWIRIVPAFFLRLASSTFLNVWQMELFP
ncbi:MULTISPECIES: hypothetical protein [unclassified Maridesulfovibrio]|uniref:hypothetical protein n=1 Tax=unclassified Maridesulfovibrio TaxID=2794999 RepID=UPI003B41B6C2